MNIQVGTKVKLSTSCLGNKIGTVGVCYETYNLGEHSGSSFIFENGNYDGFSEDEAPFFVDTTYEGFCEETSIYNFTNVIKLSNDFDAGFFKAAFK